jgi:parallel beta-helix repeat protein
MMNVNQQTGDRMFQQIKVRVRNHGLVAICSVLAAGLGQPAFAATSCVGTATGCVATISAAVTAAASGDTIQVAAGTYKEVVTITKPLSLIGAGSATTIIDATGLATGISVDGTATTAGISAVVVSGFTVKNANFQGIVVQNAAWVTISNNQVLNNNKGLNKTTATPTCPGLPTALQAGENQDCGEGINLAGAHHSVVSNNVVQGNSGGILISDDAAATHDNVISGNMVTLNLTACGITMASHTANGVYHNTVSGNQVINNGVGFAGAGAGVGIFAAGPGNKTYGNVVVNNTLTNNGLPGVTMHNHASVPGAPTSVLDDNVIAGNIISGNGADLADAATPGPTGINIFSLVPVKGLVITQNTISGESVGMAFNAPGAFFPTLNNITASFAIDIIGQGTVNAAQNWWGGPCTTGPNTAGCEVVSSGVIVTPWLTTPFTATQLPAAPGGTSPPPATGSAVTVVVTGPGGVTATGNSFQTLSLQVTLSAAGSTSTNAGALSYAWTSAAGFPVSGITGGNTATPTIQFPTPGTYQYTVTVTDATGASASATVTVQYI